MKRLTLMLTITTILLLVSGCSATTITEHEGNYIYVQNEEINILDIDTRNNIGTLKMTGTEVLKDDSFTIKENRGTDESGNDIYEDAPYEQLVQVFYIYDSKGSSKEISSSNFNVYDSTGASCTLDPDIEYSAIKRSGEEYFIIAVKNKSDSIHLNFKYNLMQTTNTAKIKLDVPGIPDKTPSQSIYNGINNVLNPLVFYFIIGVLICTVIGLIIAVIILSRRTK